ncbi:MAG: FMN-binding protein [Lachnospiraceae bacterium]|nr:FMN-binding protein [Lachnospiraceae bacterium]
MKLKKVLAIAASLSLLLGMTVVRAEEAPSKAPEAAAVESKEEKKEAEPVDVTGTQSVVIEGFDWGPGVTKTILALDQEIDPARVKAEDFTVVESKESFDWAVLFSGFGAPEEETTAEDGKEAEKDAEETAAENAETVKEEKTETEAAKEEPAKAADEKENPAAEEAETKEGEEAGTTEETEGGLPFGHTVSDAPRKVVKAYVCDEKGAEVKEASKYIALELFCDPNNGSPYCYDIFSGMNTVCKVYDLTITLSEKSALATKDGAQVKSFTVEPACDLKKASVPQLEGVDLSGKFTGSDGKTLTYGSFEPKEDGELHPLVIWLHGAGEGGTDPSIAILGNKVSALYGEEFQEVMGGAYVLTPQTPSFWLAYNEEGSWNDNPGTDSIYLKTLMELIEDYVKNHKFVDPERIVVGGCSNGGYMTMDLILNYPDYFAAAFPICEAYLDSGITDEQIEGVKNLPIWFVYAENDTVVDPKVYEIPTIERMKKAGCDVHTSIFKDVHDTTGLYKDEKGEPYQYMGHWSWLYFFNNECEEDGLNMWKWLAGDTEEAEEPFSGKYVNGTYTGKGKGMGGSITVTITIKNDVLTVDEIIGKYETPGVGGKEAIEDGTFKAQIEAAQNSEIEGVAGATMTSGGVRKAVEDVLKQALNLN